MFYEKLKKFKKSTVDLILKRKCSLCTQKLHCQNFILKFVYFSVFRKFKTGSCENRWLNDGGTVKEDGRRVTMTEHQTIFLGRVGQCEYRVMISIGDQWIYRVYSVFSGAPSLWSYICHSKDNLAHLLHRGAIYL